MRIVTRAELRELMEHRRGPCVSVYIPTHVSGAETRQDPIRLKNLLREGQLLMERQGWPADTIGQVTGPIQELIGQYSFWQHQDRGLALFSAPGIFRACAVPFEVPELVAAEDRFHLKPLFSLAEANSTYYLLALSLPGVRLYRGDPGGLEEVDDVVFAPSPLAPSADERDGKRPVQGHTAGPSGHRFLMVHGHTEPEERRKRLLLAYFRDVDDLLRSRVGGDREPVLLAGVAYLCALYRRASRYPYLLAGEIRGTPESLPVEELRQRSRELAASFFQATREKTADEYYQLWHTPRASNDIRDIASAARDGRVKTLFVSSGAPLADARPGPALAGACDDPADREVLNSAALDTFAAGGTVYAVAPELIPGRGPAAAVFRY